MITDHLKQIFTEKDFEAVEFNNHIHPRIKVQPMYFEQGFSAYPRIYGRRAVLDRITESLNFLPSEYGYLVWDVYRPREVQARLFNWMREEIRKKSPALNEDQNFEEARKYMSPPSIVGEEYCPPHLSGGAIDLTLFSLSDGKALEMGTVFDDCTERAHSNYYEL